MDYDNAFEPDAAIVSNAAPRQVFFNLFDNAMEASPAWAGFSISRQEDKLAVVVWGAGPGSRPEMLASFGKPYQSSKRRRGRGLGLFLVVNAVRKLGSMVSACNNTGKGASLTVTLPLEAPFRNGRRWMRPLPADCRRRCGFRVRAVTLVPATWIRGGGL